MSIIQLQRSIREAGRIRIGEKVGEGRGRPKKLETFRITSSDKLRIEQAAEAYGGDVTEWESPNGKQWQVVTGTDTLEVLVPPEQLAFTQWYELWSAGGCKRRCNGATEQLSGSDCLCDPAARECDIHTRLSVLLRKLPGLGVWRLDTQGYYAAVELAGAFQLVTMAIGAGKLLPARMRLEQRSVKRPDAKGKPVTLRFAVPILDLEITPEQLLSGQAETLELEEGAEPGMTPVPLLEAPAESSIAEQAAADPTRPRRANSGPELPATGRRRAERAVAPAEPVADDEPTNAAQPAEAAPAAAPDAPSEAPVRPRRAAQPAAPTFDLRYWQNRIHAAAGERGLDHDDLKLIAAAECLVDLEDLAEFSSNHMDETDFQAVDSILRGLPEAIKGEDPDADLDALSKWVWPRANAKALDSWDAIDAIVVAATGKQPDDLTLAEWVAFVVRLAKGVYDAKAAS
jgi:hypothetical protein